MKKATFLIIGILIFSCILYSEPQKLKIKYPLTEEDINDAIVDGMKGEVSYLILRDEWAALGNEGATGFSVEFLTPYARIANSAHEAKRKYAKFTREDVTEEMLVPVLLLIIHPSTPKRLIAKDAQLAQSVEHVVLADITRNIILQPSAIEFFEKEAKSGLGAEVVYKGAYVEFLIEDVIEISDRDKNKGEFYLKVIGNKFEKEFKVKQKHFGGLW